MMFTMLLLTTLLAPVKFLPPPSATAKVCVLPWTDHSNGVVSVSFTDIYGEGDYGPEDASVFKCTGGIVESWFYTNVSSSVSNNQSGTLFILTTLPFYAQGQISDDQRVATSSITLTSPSLPNLLDPTQPPVSLSDTAVGHSPTPNSYLNNKTLNFLSVVGPIVIPGMSSITVTGTCYGDAKL